MQNNFWLSLKKLRHCFDRKNRGKMTTRTAPSAPLYVVFTSPSPPTPNPTHHMSPSRVYVVCYICHPNAVTHIKRASGKGGRTPGTPDPRRGESGRKTRNWRANYGSQKREHHHLRARRSIYDPGSQGRRRERLSKIRDGS